MSERKLTVTMSRKGDGYVVKTEVDGQPYPQPLVVDNLLGVASFLSQLFGEPAHPEMISAGWVVDQVLASLKEELEKSEEAEDLGYKNELGEGYRRALRWMLHHVKTTAEGWWPVDGKDGVPPSSQISPNTRSKALEVLRAMTTLELEYGLGNSEESETVRRVLVPWVVEKSLAVLVPGGEFGELLAAMVHEDCPQNGGVVVAFLDDDRTGGFGYSEVRVPKPGVVQDW